MENMHGFRKWFLAIRKVSSGKKIINEFLMNHQGVFGGLYRTFMIHQVFDESSVFDESLILQHSNIVPTQRNFLVKRKNSFKTFLKYLSD
jgi:hypothetical protein